MMWAARWSVGALALALGGCGGGAGFSGWSTARAHVPSAEDASRERLAIGPLVVVAPSSSAPLAVLGEDGRLTGPGCDVTVGADGVVSDGASDAMVLRVEEDGRVLDAGGEERFRLEGARLVRAGGESAATIERGEGLAEVRFEGSPALALRVDGAASEALGETALVVVATLALCAGDAG